MNGQPQAPYGQAPYGQPQPQAPYGQPPEGQPQAPYGQPQPQAPYGQPQYQRQQFQPTTNYSSTYHQQGNPQGMPPYQMPVAAGEEPLRVSQYIGMMIVGALPLIGFIMLLVWAFGGSYNTNKRNYARAILLLSVILTVVSIAAIILLTLIGSSLITSINDYYNYM